MTAAATTRKKLDVDELRKIIFKLKIIGPGEASMTAMEVRRGYNKAIDDMLAILDGEV